MLRTPSDQANVPNPEPSFDASTRNVPGGETASYRSSGTSHHCDTSIPYWQPPAPRFRAAM